MEVIWHEAIRQTPHWDSLLGLAEHLEERAVVCGSIEEPEPTDTSIQDVKHDSSSSDPLSIWHDDAAIKIFANTHGQMETRVSVFVRKDSRGLIA
jgi:hypothetical protein